MNLTPFTLVHERTVYEEQVAYFRGEVDSLQALKPELFALLDRLSPGLRRTLIQSSFALVTDARDPTEVAMGALEQVLTELLRAPRIETVGLWDLNARVGELPGLISAFNNAAPTIAFFEVQAAVPAGLVSKPERVVAWAEENLHRRLSVPQRDDIVSNVIDEDFFRRARPIRQELGVDYLVGLTSSKVAYQEEREVRWNYFSSLWGKMVLSSTFDLRKFAQKVACPFEVAVGVVVLGQLLVAMNPKLRFHEDRGCLFDTCFKRKNLLSVIESPQIDAQCLQRMQPRYRPLAQSLVKALHDYR